MTYINKVFHLNSLELMTDMISNNFKVDVIITDPPYGVNLNYDNYEDTFENWKVLISEFIPLALKISRTLVVFPTSKFEGEKYLMTHFSEELLWRICWYKGSTSTRGPIGWKDWEPVFVFGAYGKLQTHDFFYVSPLRQYMNSLVLQHPCPKPRGFAEFLVKNLSKEKDIIFDPFCGTGTILEVAKNMGRNYIGADISIKYVEIAKEILLQTEVNMDYKTKTTRLF